MLLTFSKPEFEDLIKQQVKIHTIREDAGKRWKPGMKIHFWRGNPRNTRSNPYQFQEGTCTAVQEIRIGRAGHGLMVEVDGRILSFREVKEICRNDGLTLDQFRDWFVPDGGGRLFQGRIIHWTDKRY